MTNLLAAAMASAASTFTVIDRSVLCSDGIRLAYRLYKPSTTKESCTRKILCLHGWLDNAASFHLLAPALVDRDCASEVVTLDFPGHGLSSHRSPDAPQVLADYVYYVAEAARELQFEQFTLVGHSMGAGVGVVYASAFPEMVDSLVLLEGFAPLTRKGQEAHLHVRKAVESRITNNRRLFPQFQDSSAADAKQQRVYPSIDKAVQSRMSTAKLCPGDQYISKEAAFELVKRATIPEEGEGVSFRHDPRLNWPSIQYFTDEQVFAILSNISCRTCLLQADEGWPVDSKAKDAVKDALRPSFHQVLPGSHHFHADPANADGVMDKIEQFFQTQQ